MLEDLIDRASRLGASENHPAARAGCVLLNESNAWP